MIHSYTFFVILLAFLIISFWLIISFRLLFTVLVIFLWLVSTVLVISFSVISSRPVATFTLQTLAGAAAGTVDSRLQAWVPNKTVCEASDGFGDGADWRLADPSDLASVRLAAQARAPAPLDLGSGSGDYSYVPDALNDGYGCYYLGIGQLHHPSFWVFLLLLIIDTTKVYPPRPAGATSENVR